MRAKPIVAVGAVTLAMIAGLPALAVGQVYRYNGTASCTKSGCHDDQKEWAENEDGPPPNQHLNGFSQLTRDQAKSMRYASSIGLANVLDAAGRCVECHAPPQRTRFRDGVSCEVCHGPGSAYEGVHDDDPYLTNGYPQALKLGMQSLIDSPEVWTQRCVNCHVVREVALINAGHPSGDDFDLAEKYGLVASPNNKHWKTSYTARAADITQFAARFGGEIRAGREGPTEEQVEVTERAEEEAARAKAAADAQAAAAEAAREAAAAETARAAAEAQAAEEVAVVEAVPVAEAQPEATVALATPPEASVPPSAPAAPDPGRDQELTAALERARVAEEALERERARTQEQVERLSRLARTLERVPPPPPPAPPPEPDAEVLEAVPLPDLPRSPAAVVAAVQGRAIELLTGLLQRDTVVPARIAPPVDPIAYTGPDAELLRLQQEAIQLAIDALGSAPARAEQANQPEP